MKRLYELNKGSKFKIQYDSPTTVPEYSKNYVFTFDKMDGGILRMVGYVGEVHPTKSMGMLKLLSITRLLM